MIIKTCHICGNRDLSRYPYGDHLRQRRCSLKRLGAHLLSPVASVLSKKYYDVINVRTLFSSFFPIMRCQGCGYGVYARKILPEWLHKYYSSDYFQAGGLPSEQWHSERLFLDDPRAIGQYACVKDWIEKLDLKALDIGAGNAFFMRFLRAKHAGGLQLFVVEPGEGWEAYYKANDISLVGKFFPFNTELRFNYIHTSHWLEHVVDLAGTMVRLKGILEPGGFIFVEVPDCPLDYFYSDSGDVPHIHFFTKDSLQLLFKRHGFEVLTIDVYGQSLRALFRLVN